MFKKNIRFMILFLVIACLSIWAVSSRSQSFSINQLLMELSHAKPGWVGLAILFMPGFIIFEGLAVSCLTKGLSGQNHPIKGIIYGAADVYFSAITPSASGGQPASAFFMISDGIPAAHTTVILLVNLILYSISLLLFGSIALIFGRNIFMAIDLPGRVLIIFGTIVMIGLLAIFWLILKKENIIYAIFFFFIRLGGKLHIVRKPQKHIDKLERVTRQYKNCSEAVSGKRKMLLMALVWNLLQRFTQSMVTVCIYLAMDGSIEKAGQVWNAQMMASLGSNSIPIPGGMGVADYLLLQGLGTVKGVKNVVNLELLSRGLSFYGCIIVSIVIIIGGYLLTNDYHKQK